MHELQEFSARKAIPISQKTSFLKFYLKVNSFRKNFKSMATKKTVKSDFPS